MESKTAIVSFLFLVISVAVDGTVRQSSVGDDFLRNINEKRLGLCNGVPGERSVHVYIFNLTNPADFLNRKKPLPHIGDFQEIGPFNFKETRSREKCSIVLDDLNISFEDGREVLEESQLNEDFDAPLVTANIAFSHFATFVLDAHPLPTQPLMDFIRKGEGYLRQSSSPRALLINGYDISDMNFFLRDNYPFNLTELQHDKFTPFSEISYPKKFTLRSDPERFGEIFTLEGKNLGDNSSGCNVSPATDGSVFSGNVTKETILSFYSEDLCSVVPLSFKEVTTYKGIPAFKFVLADDALDIAACGCKSSGKYTDDVKTCLPAGAVDVKTCQRSLPYIVSLPHFLNANPKYTENLRGMSANDDLHLSHFIIEPVTGSVLESSLKFQLNVNLLKFKYEDIIWDDVAIQDTVFPLFWTEKKFSLAEEKVVEIRRYLEELTGTTTTVEITQETTSTGISDNTSTGTPTGTTSQDKTSPTVTKVPTAATTVGTTTRMVDATTTSPTPTNNPAFEAIKNQINDLSRNVSKFSNVLLAIVGIISVIASGSLIYSLLGLRNKPINNWSRDKI
ncbi:unnamed protein product [Allacma fusca]|uniref:Scavenger receptor class B member 1 n=1 Tax=Allacma fusca TaxID=39272 RepID=A0A8J2PDJ3_9HEXA|nr:unnamed protein product [Allacma fusca]